MKSLSLRLLFIGLLFLSSLAQAGPRFDLVIDLDWTLFYKIRAEEKHNIDQVIEHNGEYYRATDYAAEFLMAFEKHYPEARLIFFSGGDEERNKFILSQVKLSDGRTALQVADHLFSKQHLEKDTATGYDKKRILPLLPDAREGHIFSIDDLVRFYDEKIYALDSLGHFEFYPKYDASKNGKYDPKTELEWQTERNKVGYWFAALKAWVEGRTVGEAHVLASEGIELIHNTLSIRCDKIYLAQ